MTRKTFVIEPKFTKNSLLPLDFIGVIYYNIINCIQSYNNTRVQSSKMQFYLKEIGKCLK